MNDNLKAAVIGLVTTALGLLTAFHVVLTETQKGAIIAFVGAVLVVAGVFRHTTTPK